jgi:glycosyltransferase involved in cell wall biosynthesis
MSAFCNHPIDMRVIHTSPPMGPSYGGPFESVRHLSISQFAAGLDVQVKMPWSAEAEANERAWLPVKVKVGGRILLPQLGWCPTYSRDILSSEADLLHSHGLWQHPSWVSLDWKKQNKRPHVCSVRGMLEPWAWAHRAWKKRPVWWLWERRNLQSASLLHATSIQEAEALRARGLRPPIAVIPNGVALPDHLELFRPQLPEGPGKIALFLSRIHPVKGLPLLLEAWAKVRPEGWSLHIVGPDESGYRADLERLAGKLALGGAVCFLDALSGQAKARAFRESSLFILPSHSENFGIAVAEALSYGLPVITTHGTPWSILESERCGWWVPTHVEGLAAALDDATSRSGVALAAMGERGREMVASRFAWDGIAQQFIDCYRWILGQASKPDCVIS